MLYGTWLLQQTIVRMLITGYAIYFQVVYDGECDT